MAEIITVLVLVVRPLNTADGNLFEIVVRDPITGAIGSIVSTESDVRDTLGDYPASDRINVDRARITWRRRDA